MVDPVPCRLESAVPPAAGCVDVAATMTVTKHHSEQPAADPQVSPILYLEDHPAVFGQVPDTWSEKELRLRVQKESYMIKELSQQIEGR